MLGEPAMTATPQHRILIADDQPDILEALRMLLKNEGYLTESAKSPGAVVKAVEAREYALVLMDLNYARDTTSGQEGLDLLNRLQSLDASLPVVVMTAWASVDLAVEAMRRGARDFITKPWDNPRRLSWGAPCAPSGAWRPKTSCCAARAARCCLRNPPPCARCSK
jgi:DNA-binding NtrC family response regulator